MPFVEASDGVLLHYRSRGTGRPVVLVHGWTMNGRFFDQNVQELSQRFQVVTVDLRGHGRSGRDPIHLTVEQTARDLRTVIEKLDLHDAVVAGWSLGMHVVYNYLHLYGTDRLAGAVNIDMTPYVFADDGWEYGAFGNLDPSVALGFQRQTLEDRPGLAETFTPAMFAAGKPVDPETLEWWLDESTGVSDLVAQALWVSVSSQDWRPLLPKIDVPVLLLHGAKSQLFPNPVWEYLEKHLPSSTTFVFENSGHSPFWEEPEVFNRVLTEFVEGL